MRFTRTGAADRSRPPVITIVLYSAGTVIGLIAIAMLVINILAYRYAVAQYIAEGYPAALVFKQLIPSQLLPGIFEPVAIYGGMAFLLFGAGSINHKISRCLTPFPKPKTPVENDARTEIPAANSGEQPEDGAETDGAAG